MRAERDADIHVDLKNVDLPARWRALLIRAGFSTCSEILLLQPFALAKRTGLSEREVEDLLFIVSEGALAASASLPVSVFDKVGHDEDGARPFLTTGDRGLDGLLGGGVPVGSVTELAGQPSSGKSHFGLQLSLTVQLPRDEGGLEGGAIFISSEGSMPTPRLLQLAEHFATLPGRQGVATRTAFDFMDNVHVIKAPDSTTLQSLLNYAVPARIDEIAHYANEGLPLPVAIEDSVDGHTPRPPLPIRLIVIDSIGAPFRVSHDSNSQGFVSRAREMGTIGDRLHQHARRYSLAVLAINQVSDVFDYHHSSNHLHGDENTFAASTPPSVAHINANLPSELYNRFQSQFLTGQRESRGSAAALGMTWTNVVNSRLMASRSGRRVPRHRHAHDLGVTGMTEEDEDAGKVIRTMSVVFSPYAPRDSLDFLIDQGQLRSC